jgi:hypothetical protein
MAITQKEEARALNADERELVAKSHHPIVQELPDAELANLLSLVRERRDKAQGQANRRRREMRGKSEARGATPSRADEGSKLKVAVLAMAIRRLNSEMTRREGMAAKAELVENARKALELKSAASSPGPAFNSRHAGGGMSYVANQKRKNLIRPMELGRQRKAGAVAQAKRDNR